MIVRTILITLAAAVAMTETARVETIDGDRIQIVDGDTVRLGRERIRILNIDAPEIGHPQCDAEEELGRRAGAELTRLLRGRQVTIARCETATRCTDVYGRTLARLSTPEGDVGETLIASGHALRWAPGGAAKAARQAIWCDPEPMGE